MGCVPDCHEGVGLMAFWILLVALVLTFLLVAGLVLFLTARDERRRMKERLGRVVRTPQRVRHPERPSDIPKFCPICSRRMSWPVGAAKVETLTGSEVLLVCSYCLALGPMDSVISAGVDHKEYPQGDPGQARPDRMALFLLMWPSGLRDLPDLSKKVCW